MSVYKDVIALLCEVTADINLPVSLLNPFFFHQAAVGATLSYLNLGITL